MPSILNPGDIAIVGFNTSTTDGVRFLLLTDIESGTTFNVTDNGWQSTGSFRTGEGVLTYTAPANLPAGTVLTWTNASLTNSPGFSSNNPTNFALNASGDSLILYTGALTAPTLIYALNSSVAWSNATSAATSAEPTAANGGTLVAGASTVSLLAANGYYAGVTSGSKAQLLAAISNSNNWTTSASLIAQSSWPSTFSVSAGTATVNLAVSRTTGSEAGLTSITVTATASSAVSGDQTVNLTVTGTGITAGDYTLTNPVITIPNGQTSGSVTFTVVDDALVEGTETAVLSLTNPSAGISLGATTTQNITIADNEVALAPVDLSTYVRIGRYDLPEPTRTTAPTNSLLAQEVSAITYNWDTDTLFVVGDGSTSIVQISKTGQLIDSMTLAPGSSPQGTDFYDTEGLTYVGGGKFVLVEERDRQASLFTYLPGGTLTRSGVQTVKLGTTIGNIGIEGISYDPLTNGFIAVKEIQPEGIFQTGVDFAAGTATNGSPTTVNSIDLFNPALANLADFADVFALSNLPGLNGQADYSHLLVLSQESGKIVNIDRAGNISSSLTIVSDPGNPLSIPDQQHEGLTVDRNGILYVVSENGGGDINHPQLWVYAPSTVPNQAPTAVGLNNALPSIVENTSTATRLKVADITVTDDGLGTNTLTVTGADANFFEIFGSGLYIKAGTVLDYETKTSYSVSVNVDDATLGSSPDATTTYTLAVTDVVNEGNPASSSLIISEVTPWGSGNSPYAADWFEVTNTGNSAVNLSGWKIDDNSNAFASAVALRGVTSIAAGQSLVFLEGLADGSTDATIVANFSTAWFGSATPPANILIGTYGGAGVGLSSAGDAVNLFDAIGNRVTGISFGASPTAAPFATFDNAAGLGSTTLPLPTVSALSAAGVNGAFLAADGVEIGSPGRIVNPPMVNPTVAIAATDATAAEAGQDPGTFRITRTGSTTSALTVNYTVAGQATGTDYTPNLTGTASIPVGSSFVDITITPVDDTLVETSETVTLTLTSGTGYILGASAATVTIVDNDVAVTKIHDIQGSGTSFNTAFGGTQTIEGIVVAAFQGSTKLNGFYVQEEDADADADVATSEGIFVFDPTGLFSGSVGSKVRITGTVGEFTTTSTSIAGAATSSLTQLSGLSSVLNLGTFALPTVTNVVLPVTDASGLERYEGMLVNVGAAVGPLTVTETFKLGRFGQVGLSTGGRIDQYTQVNAPSVSGYTNYVANLLDNYIILDDGSGIQNPDPVIHARGGQPLSATNTLRGGDTIASITGVLDQRFEGYRVQTTAPADFAATNARAVTAPAVGGTLRVASGNLLNFFNGNGLDANSDGLVDGGFPTARGANTAGEFKRQIDKTVQEVLGLNADVFGYNEVENDGYGSASAIQQLVNALNAATAPGTYAFVLPPASALNANGGFGGDEISVGFIYKPTAVRIAPGTTAAALTTGIFAQDAANRVQRPALAVTFERLTNGTPTNETFTAVINHFKSKGSAANLPGDADQNDGQGLSNATRTQAAQQLAAWLATNPTGTADADYLILGDLNSYRLEDPIATLTNAGYSSLFGPESYSYQFNGQWGSLDHALASGSLATQVTGAAKWHINSDEPIVLDYNTEFKTPGQVGSFYNVDPFRTSDHDPIVVGLNLTANNTAPIAGADSVTTAEDAAVTFNVLTNDSDANGDPLTVISATATSNGSLVNNGNGSFTYTPALNFNGSDSFSYTLSDGKGGTATAMVSLTVTPVNDAAVITGTIASAVTEDAVPSTATGTLTATDVDSPATFQSQANTAGTYGSFAIGTNGAWTYSLDNSRTATNALTAGQTVTEVFTTATADGTTQAVTITVNGSNDAPVVSGAITATATEDAAPLTVNLLANATDPDFGTSLNVANLVLASGNAAGVTVNGNTLNVTPNAYTSLAVGQTSVIRYNYNIVDGSGGSVAQTATFTIQGLNDAPIAATDNITTTEKTSASFNVLTNDSDPDAGDRFTLTGFNFGGLRGTTTIGSNGSVTYNPGTAFRYLGAGQTAVETLSYTIADTKSASSTGTVNITVTGLNDAPVLNPSLVQNLPTINEDPTVNPGVLVATFLGSAITDPDANALQGIAVTQTSSSTAWQYSSNGGTNWTSFGSVSTSSSLLLAATTLVRYNPALNFNGSASLTYRAWDQSSGSVGSKVSTSTNGNATAFSTQTATSGLSIQAVNDAPVNTLPASQSVTQGSVLTFGNRISISDVDAGSNPLQVSLGVSRGVLTLSGLSGLTFSSGDGTDDATLTFSGTQTAINAALNGLKFTPDAAAVLQGNVTLTLTSDDLGSTGLVTGPTSSTSSLAIAVRQGRVVNGTAANNTLNGNGGADFISGLGGNDTIYGNGGSDILLGGDGNDTIYVGGGTGWIDGGLGNDTIYLGGGNDTIVLAAGNGTDTIYNVPAGSTHFSLSAGLSFGNLSIVQNGNNTLIKSGTENLASLVGVQASSITASRFV